ncbi:MAG: peptidase [Gemmatimonadetes bacterium]|nr:peptidase [Gemmatimonadota bacterium]
MTNAVAERLGVRHLVELARRPRPAGGAAETDARAYARRTLEQLGYTVREEEFEYSAFPGRYATPVGGGFFALTIIAASSLALSSGGVGAAGAMLIIGVVAAVTYAQWMMRYGVLDFPFLRMRGINLAAVRGAAEPNVWLVAHLDSKSQPVPSAARVGGIALLVLALLLAVAGAFVTLAGVPSRMLWIGALAAAIVGALPVLASVVGSRSDGAVDNASGAAAVLAAAALVGRGVPCGVLLPSAEELGLAGGRAWARAHAATVALNCDGVDDEGELVIMYNGRIPTDVVSAVRAASSRPARVRRMPLGLLTDSTALADAGWRTVTVSHGSLGTLRRVHTSRDSLDNMRGTSVDDVSVILARAAEALAS